MASLSRIYSDTSRDNRLATPRTRFGGPRRRPPATTKYEQNERYGRTDYLGSHMPLDTAIHWKWRNPLNLLPALILVFLAAALLSMVLA